MVSTVIQTEQNMRVSGSMISSMAQVKRLGQMVIITKVASWRVRNMVKVSKTGSTAISMLDNTG